MLLIRSVLCMISRRRMKVELSPRHREQQRAHATDSGGLGRRGEARQDGAEHRENQQQRRQQCAQHANERETFARDPPR